MDQHTASKQIFLPLALIIPKPSNNTWSNTLQTSKQTFLPLGSYPTQSSNNTWINTLQASKQIFLSSWEKTQATILE
jgi:hypothetical protein